ncbi:MAG: iron chelate uptake ABC transporter family permease subunit [Acidimicrobiales bacterium]|nr:iron chelate uptake ABC transporter family permease subunit [Acidimicrobiales bacterium]
MPPTTAPSTTPASELTGVPGEVSASVAGGSGHTRALVVAGSALLLAVVVVASFVIGSRSIPAGHVWDSFFAFDGSLDHQIVRDSRVPRAVVGVLVGAALGLAGALMQGLTRNPLADPGILGIESGASLGAVLAIQTIGWTDLRAIVWFAFAGAAVAAAVVTLLGSSGRGGANPVKLALAGAAATSLLTSITTGILLSDPGALDSYRFWVVGSINGRDMSVAARVAPFIVIGTALAFASARWLNSLALGDDVARGLGVQVVKARVLTSVAVVLLAGAAVAAAGPIGFIGLAVPHVARAVVGHDYRWILGTSVLLGPVMLLGADIAGRVLAPGELQAGVVTAVIGAPVLIYVVRRASLGGL